MQGWHASAGLCRSRWRRGSDGERRRGSEELCGGDDLDAPGCCLCFSGEVRAKLAKWGCTAYAGPAGWCWSVRHRYGGLVVESSAARADVRLVVFWALLQILLSLAVLGFLLLSRPLGFNLG